MPPPLTLNYVGKFNIRVKLEREDKIESMLRGGGGGGLGLGLGICYKILHRTLVRNVFHKSEKQFFLIQFNT